jgi:acyl-CoA synthetase (AMP-forming)/AMP-acid ligase II
LNDLAASLESSLGSHADAPALVHAGTITTYAELARMSRAVGDRVRNAVGETGRLVAVGMSNGPALVTAYIGAWSVGAIVVELPASMPASDRPMAAEGIGAAAIIVASEDDPLGIDVVPLGGVAVGERSLACINLTSGTTSRSKAVALSDRNLLRNAELYVRHVGLDEEDRTCLPLPLSFGMNKIALLANLLSGARVILEQGAAVPNALLDSMATAGATALVAVPSLMRSIVRHGDVGARPVPSMRRIRIGAGVVDERLLLEIRDAFPSADVVMTYGLTEVGLVAVLTEEELHERPGSCGRPIPDVEVSVEGEEILVRCEHAASGYWGDQAATERTFGDGRVRTGDTGRLEDGYLYLTGRLGGIIKSGGESIAPDEVEAAFLRHPLVEDCAVIGVPDGWLGETIVAFVVPAGAGLTEAALREHAIANLAPIRRPRRYVIREDLPRGPSGKLMRHTLAMDGSDASATRPR